MEVLPEGVLEMIMRLHTKSRKGGISLIEVMVAIFLISVAMASTLPILYRMIRYTRAMKLRSKAIYFAEKQMEKIKAWPIYSNDSGMARKYYWLNLQNRDFWDYDQFQDRSPGIEPECLITHHGPFGNPSTLSCSEYLIPGDVGVVFQRTTWLIRNGTINGRGDGDNTIYNCNPVLFGSATGDFQQAAPSNREVNEGPIYLSNGTAFSNSALTLDGVTGAPSTASMNAWASYRWSGKRRFVRYDGVGCGGQYPYRGEDFVFLEVDMTWRSRIAGHSGAQAVERTITRSSIIRGR